MSWLITIYKTSGYFKVDKDMVMGLGLKLVNMHTPMYTCTVGATSVHYFVLNTLTHEPCG